MENLRCQQCGNYPNGEVFQCSAKDHIYCIACKEAKNRTLCACGAKLKDGKSPNPIEKLLNQAMCPCRYASNGCTWKFVQSEMDAHVLECRYRPYRCVAASMNVIKCDWRGLQHEIENHLTEDHKELGPVFRFRETTSLVFKEQLSLGGLKLVDAFSKRFLFYFFSDAARKKLSFLMIYFGRCEEANLYCYELEIRARPFAPIASSTPSEQDTTAEDGTNAECTSFSRSVKFVERCCSDSEDLCQLVDEEQCVTLSHRQVLNYVHEGKLHIGYKVRKVDGTARERKASETAVVVATGPDPPLGKATPVKPKPRPPPFVFAQKGTLPGPGKRSASSSSSTSTASSNSTSSSSTSGASAGSGKTIQRSTSVVSVPSVERSPSSASTVIVSSQRNSSAEASTVEDALVNRNSLSSINRVTTPLTPFEKPEQCPLMTPSINKHDVPPSWTVSQTTMSSYAYHTSVEYHRQLYGHEPYRTMRHLPPAECTTNAAICQKFTQPYKVKDDRLYLMKYSTNPLCKPQPKWSPGNAGTHGKKDKGGWSA